MALQPLAACALGLAVEMALAVLLEPLARIHAHNIIFNIAKFYLHLILISCTGTYTIYIRPVSLFIQLVSILYIIILLYFIYIYIITNITYYYNITGRPLSIAVRITALI